MQNLCHSRKLLQISQICDLELGKFTYKIVRHYIPGFISWCYSHVSDKHNHSTRITNKNLTTTLSKKLNVKKL